MGPSVLEKIHAQRDEDELDLSLSELEKVPLDEIRMNHGGGFTSLLMSHNVIESLSPTFILSMVYLKKLDLSKNLIRKLPDSFGCMRNLEYLDLHLNKLETLPISMCKLSQLRYLNITQNPLRPPLNKFLEMEVVNHQNENFKITQIHPIIQFMKNFAAISPQIGFGDTTEALLVMENQRFASHHLGRTPGGIQDEDDEKNRNMMASSSPSLEGSGRKLDDKSRQHSFPFLAGYPDNSDPTDSAPSKTSFGRGMIFLLFFLMLTPLIVALMVDHHFFAALANDPDGSWFWKFYHPVHSTLSSIVLCHCRLTVPLLIQAPPTPPGFLAAIITFLKVVYSSVTGFIGVS